MAEANHKVLLIDDEPNLLFAIKAVMKRAGFDVSTAVDGTSGLERIRQERPEVIVCDMMMPHMNGLELKTTLAEDPTTADIPFIFLTARAYQADKVAGLSKGADDYITKPCQPEELVERVHAVLRRNAIGKKQGRVEALEKTEQVLRFLYETRHLVGKEAQCVQQLVNTELLAEKAAQLRTRAEFEARLDTLKGNALFPLSFVAFTLSGLHLLDTRVASRLLGQIIDTLFGVLGNGILLFRLGPEQFVVMVPQSGVKVRRLHQTLRAEVTEAHRAMGAIAPNLLIGTAIAQQGDCLSDVLAQAEKDVQPAGLEEHE